MKAPSDAAIGQIMDIGTGVITPVKKVAEMVIEISGSKSKIKYVPLRTGKVKVHTKADNANAKNDLDWEPRTDLRESIKRAIPYYAKRLGIPSPV